MLTLDQMKTLKQKNVCTDAEKTKLRFREDFKSAANADKVRIVELSGQKRSSFYRVFTSGAANARLVLAISTVLGVSPFYYTGELDEREPMSDAALNAFLARNGYDSLVLKLKESKPPRRRREKAAPEHAEGVAALEAGEESEAMPGADTLVVKLTFENSPEMQKAIAELTFEQATLLLQALLIRGEAGGNAKQYADIVKLCLLA